MPDGKTFERPSGVEHRSGVDVILSLEAADDGGVFTLSTGDEPTQSALLHVLAERYGTNRLHQKTLMSGIRITIDPGEPAVSDDIRSVIVMETETALKRMGVAGPEDEGVEKAA